MEGEEVFGSTKHKLDLPPGSNVDSHQHDRMNFSHLKVANATTPINQQLIIDVGKASGANLIVTHNGVEVLQCLCGDNIWLIEHCPEVKQLLLNVAKRRLTLLQTQNHF